jgi:hypothetical protein
MADTASFSAAMKTKFIGPIRDTLHSGKVLLFGSGGEGANPANPTGFKGILANSENIDFVGNEFRIPLKATRNQAVGFRSEGETLPAAGASTYTYLSEPMRYAYGVFNITGQLLKASESNEGAFKQAFKQEMEDVTTTIKGDVNRAAYGDGSGKFADVRTTNASTSATVDVSSTINFRGGEYVDVVTAGGTVINAAALRVTSVDRTNRNITVSPNAPAVTAGTHFFVRASSDSTSSTPNNSQNKEIQGLASIVAASGTLHGVNPTTYPFWKAYSKGSVGAISDSVLRDAIDGVGFESGVDLEGGDHGFIMLTTRGIRRRYSDTLLSVKRFNDAQSVTLHGGFKTVMFDEMPIFTDDQCPTGTLYGLSTKDLFWSQLSDWEWLDRDGSVLKRDDRKDRYTATLFAYKQLGTVARNRHLVLTGVTDDVR